jgi:hypothetical protein
MMRGLISRLGHALISAFQFSKEQKERERLESLARFESDLEYVIKALKIMDEVDEKTPSQIKDTDKFLP